MTKQQMLELLRTLSALESWALAQQAQLPPQLAEKVDSGVAALEKAILGESQDSSTTSGG